MSEPKTAEVRVVPVEPTEAMIDAADTCGNRLAGSDIGTDEMTRQIWSAMLAASPPAETGEGEPVGAVYAAALDTLRKGAPGLSDLTRMALARSINMKATLSAQPVSPSEVKPDAGREALWKLIHEVWQLLDDGETDGSTGITTVDQGRLQAVSDAMDALEALVPDSERPFWGGFPVNYLWPKPHPASDKSDTERMRATDERSAFEVWYCADAAQHGLTFMPAELLEMREGDGYGEHRVALNSKWEGWQARAALAEKAADQ